MATVWQKGYDDRIQENNIQFLKEGQETINGEIATLVPMAYLLSAEFGASLPTVAGATGELWNDLGTVKVSV